jgi:hypothetical protein
MNSHPVSPSPRPRSSRSASSRPSLSLRALVALALAGGVSAAAAFVACASDTSRPTVLGDCGDARACAQVPASGGGPGVFDGSGGFDGGTADGAIPFPTGTTTDAGARASLFPTDAPVGNALIPINSDM